MKQMVLGYPASATTITHLFGEDSSNHPIRKDYYNVFDNKHPGVDFDVPEGTEIKSAGDGIVVRSEWHEGMGNVVGVRNGNIVMLYAHLSRIDVSLGQIITQGEIIGQSGNSGKAIDTPHLHFEIRDISKASLSEMVFDPPFGRPVKQWKSTFEYKINNQNTVKTWRSLSVKYFGNEKYWRLIEKENEIFVRDPDVTLPEGKIIVIPNIPGAKEKAS